MATKPPPPNPPQPAPTRHCSLLGSPTVVKVTKLENFPLLGKLTNTITVINSLINLQRWQAVTAQKSFNTAIVGLDYSERGSQPVVNYPNYNQGCRVEPTRGGSAEDRTRLVIVNTRVRMSVKGSSYAGEYLNRQGHQPVHGV